MSEDKPSLDDLHRPSGPYCCVCDDKTAGDTTGNNPECPHYWRVCRTCRDTPWPCRTSELVSQLRADTLRDAATRLRESVPEDVFLPNGTSVDAASARVRRVDAMLLQRWAGEVA
jgi:hypothetical protein